jgi:hypothetical protein
MGNMQKLPKMADFRATPKAAIVPAGWLGDHLPKESF